MASTINVTLGKDEAVFKFNPVDRNALYGKRRRIALDDTGAACSRASLLDDGSLLLRSGMTGQGYFLPDGSWVPQAELEGIQPDGSPAELVPSTLGVAQPLSEASAQDLLDLRVTNTYALTPESLPKSIEKKLSAGAIYSFSFNYRADYRAETAMLFGNDTGYWALIGVPTNPSWQELGVVTAFAEDLSEEADDDDLDFEMF